jgi:lipopolysaccharide/colanic/teichoic acid biosynthesis glycosyltransferase
MSASSISFGSATVNDTLQRFITMIVAAFGLLCVSPIFLLIALLIVLDSPGPVFYRAQRIGKSGRIFHLLKFRSMVVNADRQGPGITSAGDRRITRMGHFLRRTKLDELPQLLNVLRGDMNFVGPRPEDPRYVALYTAEQQQILAVRPGITSAASLAFRHEEQLLTGHDWETVYRTQVMPSKLAIDLAYLGKRTLLSDLGLIVRTIIAMIQ